MRGASPSTSTTRGARPFLYPAAARSLEGSTVERVHHLLDTTREVIAALKAVFGERLHETPVIAELLADDILAMALERDGVTEPPIVPYEASAALAMLLLRDYGILTVHFVGLPPGTSALMFKFISPDQLKRFGGAQAYARAVDASLNKLAGMLKHPEQLRELLLGDASWALRKWLTTIAALDAASQALTAFVLRSMR